MGSISDQIRKDGPCPGAAKPSGPVTEPRPRAWEPQPLSWRTPRPRSPARDVGTGEARRQPARSPRCNPGDVHAAMRPQHSRNKEIKPRLEGWRKKTNGARGATESLYCVCEECQRRGGKGRETVHKDTMAKRFRICHPPSPKR